MAENYILPWAQTSTANALSDADYASDMATNGSYVDGVKSGQASSQQANKTWRQGTSVAAGLAQFLVDNLAVDVTDADVPATFSSRITNAIIMLGQISNFNQSFATAIGGYKKYAIVSDSSGNYWSSTADQNITVPGTSGSKWVGLMSGYLPLAGGNITNYLTVKNNTVVVGVGGSNANAITQLSYDTNADALGYLDTTGTWRYARPLDDYSKFVGGWGANGYIEIPTNGNWKFVQQWVVFQGTTGPGGSANGIYETDDIFVTWPLGMSNLLRIAGLSVEDVGGVGMNEKVWVMFNPSESGGSFRLACNEAGVTMTGSALIIGSVAA